MVNSVPYPKFVDHMRYLSPIPGLFMIGGDNGVNDREPTSNMYVLDQRSRDVWTRSFKIHTQSQLFPTEHHSTTSSFSTSVTVTNSPPSASIIPFAPLPTPLSVMAAVSVPFTCFLSTQSPSKLEEGSEMCQEEEKSVDEVNRKRRGRGGEEKVDQNQASFLNNSRSHPWAQQEITRERKKRKRGEDMESEEEEEYDLLIDLIHSNGTFLRPLIFIAGGYSGTRAQPEAYFYDPVKNAWKRLPFLNQRRCSCSMVYLDGIIYLVRFLLF